MKEKPQKHSGKVVMEISDYRSRLELGTILLLPLLLTLFIIPESSPRDWSYIWLSRATSEIESCELALSEILTDAECSSLSDLFDASKINAFLDSWNKRFPEEHPQHQPGGIEEGSLGRLRAASELYTRLTYVLLRDGRGVLQDGLADRVLDGMVYAELLNIEQAKLLSSNYLPELGFDPWGNLYNFYPGPWNIERDGPIPFRKFTIEKISPDSLKKLQKNNSLGEVTNVGSQNPSSSTVKEMISKESSETTFSASPEKQFYIWSNGGNQQNNQVFGQPDSNYNAFGTDDINNWDSSLTWEVFYENVDESIKIDWLNYLFPRRNLKEVAFLVGVVFPILAAEVFVSIFLIIIPLYMILANFLDRNKRADFPPN